MESAMTFAEVRQPKVGEAISFRRQPPLNIPPGNLFVRTLTANIVGHVRNERATEVAARLWPSDRMVATVLERAASAPAMTGVAGWAAELAQKKVVDTLLALHPASASAALFAAGTALSFDGTGQISVPGFTTDFGNKGFVAEGQPIPVHQLALTPGLLKPHKCAGIVVLTREMIESSNAETLVGDAALRMLGRMLDEVVVDANPEAADRPAGLRYNVAATAASAATDHWQAFIDDMGNLAQAVQAVSGNDMLVYIMGAGRRVRATLYYGAELESSRIARTLSSGAVVNDVLCVAAAALVSAFGDPAVETSTAATLHMDNVPNIDPGSAAIHKSMFQSDALAIKLRWPVTWLIRDSRGFAWTTPTAW
jgi:hypothetical protein